MNEHITSNNLHEPYQSAYKRAHSTETALIKVSNDIIQALDKGSAVVLVMLDLSAAFDTIDHSTLLKRMEHEFGINGAALEWFNSYLSARFQSVSINDQYSSPAELKYGVPQGSVLGPKLFTMYTKPLGQISKAHKLDYHFYADDSQNYIAFRPSDNAAALEVVTRVEACVCAMRQWMESNMLKVNDDKTEVVLFTPSRKSMSLSDIANR